jgi:hypothetical protein
MALENEKRPGDRGEQTESSPDALINKASRNREDFNKVPESGWEAGQGISNSQVITQSSGEDQNGTERGPSDAGIGMAEIRKKKEGSWGSGSSLE